MRVYEATVMNDDPDFKGHRWNVAVLTKQEEREYVELDTEDEFNAFVKAHTAGEFSDEDINFYVGEEDVKGNTIESLDYIFGELTVIY